MQTLTQQKNQNGPPSSARFAGTGPKEHLGESSKGRSPPTLPPQPPSSSVSESNGGKLQGSHTIARATRAHFKSIADARHNATPRRGGCNRTWRCCRSRAGPLTPQPGNQSPQRRVWCVTDCRCFASQTNAARPAAPRRLNPAHLRSLSDCPLESAAPWAFAVHRRLCCGDVSARDTRAGGALAGKGFTCESVPGAGMTGRHCPGHPRKWRENWQRDGTRCRRRCCRAVRRR